MKMHVIFGRSLFNNLLSGSLRFRSMLLLMLSMCILLSAVPLEAQAAGGAYTIKWYAADPAVNTGPYLPTYEKLMPSELQCGAPLLNAVAYASPANPSNLDAVTSLAPKDMMLGQIVPFEIEITVNGDTSPENGVIIFTGGWSTHTTSGDDFGYDPNYGVYCAFVDTTDPGNTDPEGDAQVSSTYMIVDSGSNNEEIQGTFTVSGLDTGDKVIVEVWVVLKSILPPKASGNVQSRLIDAETATDDSINTGTQTIPFLRLSQIEDFYYKFDLTPKCAEPITLTVTPPNDRGLSLEIIWIDPNGNTAFTDIVNKNQEGVYTITHTLNSDGSWSVEITEYSEAERYGEVIGTDSFIFELDCDGPEFPIGSFIFLLLAGVMYLAMRRDGRF